MGAFSIWHWLIILLVVGLVPAVIVVRFTQSVLTQKEFVLRISALLAVGYVVGLAPLQLIMMAAPDLYVFILVPSLILGLVFNVFTFRWTVMRLNGVGWNRWWSFLWVAWPAGLVLAFVLCFERDGKSQAEFGEQ